MVAIQTACVRRGGCISGSRGCRSQCNKVRYRSRSIKTSTVNELKSLEGNRGKAKQTQSERSALFKQQRYKSQGRRGNCVFANCQ